MNNSIINKGECASFYNRITKVVLDVYKHIDYDDYVYVKITEP